jgi:hypothetical protein
MERRWRRRGERGKGLGGVGRAATGNNVTVRNSALRLATDVNERIRALQQADEELKASAFDHETLRLGCRRGRNVAWGGRRRQQRHKLRARELDIAGHGDFVLAATTLTAAAASGSRG